MTDFKYNKWVIDPNDNSYFRISENEAILNLHNNDLVIIKSGKKFENYVDNINGDKLTNNLLESLPIGAIKYVNQLIEFSIINTVNESSVVYLLENLNSPVLFTDILTKEQCTNIVNIIEYELKISLRNTLMDNVKNIKTLTLILLAEISKIINLGDIKYTKIVE